MGRIIRRGGRGVEPPAIITIIKCPDTSVKCQISFHLAFNTLHNDTYVQVILSTLTFSQQFFKVTFQMSRTFHGRKKNKYKRGILKKVLQVA